MLVGAARLRSSGHRLPVFGGSGVSFAVTVKANVAPLSLSTVAPTVTVGDPIEIDMNGACIEVRTAQAGTPDSTKLSVQVTRPGFNAAKAAVTNTDTIVGTGYLRQPAPDYTLPARLTPDSTLNVLTEQIFAQDVVSEVTLAAGYLPGSPLSTFSSVGRQDSVSYPAPICGIVNPPYERIDAAGLRVEVAVGSRFGRSGRMAAAVDIWIEDSLGNPGPVTTVTAMTPSQYAPNSGRVTPRYTPAYVFAGNVLATGLADGAGRIFYKVYPWVGTAFSSKTDLPTATWPHMNQPSDGLPCCIDVAGAHAPVYAWVNQDGTTGASPAVQTGTSDPGSAGGYATPAAAATALKAYNNTNRGHNDLSGGVIMLRDVAGSTAGASAGSYSTRGTAFAVTATYTPGLTPLRIKAASGVTSQLCRWRGQQADGTTLALSVKGVASRVIWENVYFDGVGLTGNDNIAIDGTGAGLPTSQPTAAASVVQIFKNCVERGNPAATSAVRYRMGFMYDYMTDSLDPAASSGYNNENGFCGMVVSIGCKYARTTFGSFGPSPRILLGFYNKNVSLITQSFANGNIPVIRHLIWGMGEVYANTNTGSIIRTAIGAPLRDMWIGQIVACTWNAGGSATMQFGADSTHYAMDNVVIDYLTIPNQRINAFYNDQGYYPIPKNGCFSYCVFDNFNNKRDTFGAPETATASNDGAYNSARDFYQGMIVSNSGIYYQALRDGPAGTAITDASYFYQIPSPTTAFGAQPRRLGAMRTAYGVGCKGNVFRIDGAGDTSAGPTSWFGEVVWRNSAILVTPAYVNNTSGTGTNNPADDGDYTPSSGSAQISRVAIGEQKLPGDLWGRARLDDGTGAAGALEHL